MRLCTKSYYLATCLQLVFFREENKRLRRFTLRLTPRFCRSGRRLLGLVIGNCLVTGAFQVPSDRLSRAGYLNRILFVDFCPTPALASYGSRTFYVANSVRGPSSYVEMSYGDSRGHPRPPPPPAPRWAVKACSAGPSVRRCPCTLLSLCPSSAV